MEDWTMAEKETNKKVELLVEDPAFFPFYEINFNEVFKQGSPWIQVMRCEVHSQLQSAIFTSPPSVVGI